MYEVIYWVGTVLNWPLGPYWVLSILEGGIAAFMFGAALHAARRGRWAVVAVLVGLGVYWFGDSFAVQTQYYPPMSAKDLIGCVSLVVAAYRLSRASGVVTL
ncbi:MAG: hypothetical protein IVW51_15360 [Thermaceae bacterium]|nr:hypothetical protein [Thermaceae bacterium]